MRGILKGTIFSAAWLALATHGTVVRAQNAEALEVPADQSYGFALGTHRIDYAGEEIETADGRIVSYRENDRYDSYEAAEGANATFIDMKSGKSRLVLPKNGPQLLFFLSIVYAQDDPDIGIGYVARVGTKEDYAQGRIDVVVGRFTDLEQAVLFKNVRFVDSPTGIGTNAIAMIVWSADDDAHYTVVDLQRLTITQSDPVELPLPVESDQAHCQCIDASGGERECHAQ